MHPQKFIPAKESLGDFPPKILKLNTAKIYMFLVGKNYTLVVQLHVCRNKWTPRMKKNVLQAIKYTIFTLKLNC